MANLLTIIGGAVVVVGGLFFLPILGAFFGGVGGWIVGIVFGDLILGVLAAFGIKGLTMWQLGVTLGFLSGYFKSSTTVNKD
ncbi:MAG: hypothetical protein ACK5O1_07035 [Holosporales bacterium]|jgi:hypothetical protein